MASPPSSNVGQPVNFHTNVNRAKTKRWVEAKSYAYDGDDWGEGDEYEEEYQEPHPQPTQGRGQHPQSPMYPQNPNPNADANPQPYPGQRYGDLPHRQPGQFGNRSSTNPPPMHNRNQPSFDQGDERRTFSTNEGGFEGPYPTSQRAPFSLPDQFPNPQHSESRMGLQRGLPPLSTSQQGHRPSMDQEPFPRTSTMSDSRPGPYSDPRSGPYPSQLPSQGRRSQSSGRPSHADIYGGRDSPSRAIPSPLSAVSRDSRDGSPARVFPPRKSSLSQKTGPPEFIQPPLSRESGMGDDHLPDSPVETKPLPFIRPADIYKRMAEEKERERRASEESSRPSIDDMDSQKRLKPALDPVAERRSEYGMENLVKGNSPGQDSSPSMGPSERTNDAGQRELTGEDSMSTLRPPQHTESSVIPSEPQAAQANTIKGDVLDDVASNDPERTKPQPETASSLRHNPSAGFTSIVHQAFDYSQTKVPPTPSSTSGNSIVRSNSASASEISPVIEGGPGDKRERPMSSSTITPTTTQDVQAQDSDPLPPPIRPGYRRDSRTPSPGNSPARHLTSMDTSGVPRGEVGVLAASTPIQAQPEHGMPATIPRAESPTKGTVRDMAGRFENRSPASSPVRSTNSSPVRGMNSSPARGTNSSPVRGMNSSPVRGHASVVETPRPSNPRLESFRPSLPGGWNSYTTSTGASSPALIPTPLQSTDNLSGASHGTHKDDIPTAGPPKPREQGYETSGKAFEALAAAGSALSTAFGTITGIHQDDSSENETPTEISSNEATPARERFGGLSPVQEVLSVASSKPPTPPGKDGPLEQKGSQQGYFPSPLRPNKSNEKPTPMRPQMLPALSTDNSPQDTENDRLRKEIVRSLTPKSAKGESHLRTEYEVEPVPKPTYSAASDSPEEKHGNLTTASSEEGRFWDEPAQRESAIAGGELQAMQSEADQYAPTHTDGIREPSHEDFAATGTRRPMLQKRFSWEASTENVGPMSKPADIPLASPSSSRKPDTVDSPQTIRAPTYSAPRPDPLRSNPSEDNVTRRADDMPTIIPVAGSNGNLRSDLPPHLVAQSSEHAGRSIDSVSARQSSSPSPSLPDDSPQTAMPPLASNSGQETSDSPLLPPKTAKELSFREILSINTPQERIRAYNNTRQQLAHQESGLASWVQNIGQQHPEHHALLNHNGRLLAQQGDTTHAHKPSPSRSKFPQVGTSFGAAGQQSPTEANDTPKPTFGSPSSGKLTSQQVQEEGKKLLQTAGKFGGKAGGAAKGLFAKGKSKLRASSGGDKALPSSRQASQPKINVEEAQHSSGTATAAPQLAPLFKETNTYDTWSLSYAASDNVSRTTTVEKPPPVDERLAEGRQYANLGPPGYSDDAVNAQDRLRRPSVPSPQVSALGSVSQDDIPSRTISEVTRPDEPVRNVSPNGSNHCESALAAADTAAHTSETRFSATKNTQQSPSVLSTTSDRTSLPMDVVKASPASTHTLNQNPHEASSGSSYSQLGTDANFSPKPIEAKIAIGNYQSRTELLSTQAEPRRSMVSAVSSPSPGPPASDREDVSPAVTRQNSTPARQDVDVAGDIPAVSPPVGSPPYEDATPPYSETLSSKEVEAATEKSLEAFADHRQSLPAYQSPIQERTPQPPFQASAIVPVGDISARKWEDGRRPTGRPFSFIDTSHEDILHRNTLSKDSQHTSGAVSSLSKELGADVSDSGERPHSRSYSSHSNDPNVDQHPALRGSADKPLPSQIRNYTPPQRPTQQSVPANMGGQSEQQYRIPGPYGQQFKFSKPVSFSTNIGQTPAQRAAQSTVPAGSGRMGRHPAVEYDRHHGSDVSVISRPSTTDYALQGIRPPQSIEPLSSTPNSRAATTKNPRQYPRSGTRLEDEDFDLRRSQTREDQKKENRSSVFRRRSKQDTESISSQVSSLQGRTSRSPSSLGLQRLSPDIQFQNGSSSKAKDSKFTKKLQRSSIHNDQTQSEGKKKGGFSRLSSLFGKSGKERSAGAQQEYIPRAVNLQPIQTAPLPRTSTLTKPAPSQQQQFYSRGQAPAHGANDPRMNSLRGQPPPNQVPAPIEYQSRRIPRDPDSFIGGRRLSDQRAVEQARAQENVSRLRSQLQAGTDSQHSPPPQPFPKTLPQSAPASMPYFDRNQIQQPRATSQRFPPDLRIDTSGRFNPNRRSQPPPVIRCMQPQEPIPRAQPSLPSATSNKNVHEPNPIPLPTHSKSTPQRQSPYTDRNSQHSPYGYGSARGLRKDNLSHAIDLHKRSRSPRNGRRDSYSSQEERTLNAQDPANRLGTFAETGRRSRSQRGVDVDADGADGDGDRDGTDSGRDGAGQEKPWKIDLPPGIGSPGSLSSGGGLTSSSMHYRLPLPDAAGNGLSPLSSSGYASVSTPARAMAPVELPGSKAPGAEDSDEEIIMCSTAYPGQEWTPDMNGFARWED